MAEIFRADEDDWKWIECGNGPVTRCIHELRDRVAALESRADTPSAPAATPHPDVPSDEELWAIRLRGLEQECPGGGWAPWRPRKSVSAQGVAMICAHRALFNAGVEWATRRAEQQAATEESSAPQPAPADPASPQTLHSIALGMVGTLRQIDVLPQICDTIERAIREPMVTPPEPGKVATDEELRSAWASAYDAAEYGHGYRDEMRFVDGLRGVYNLGRRHGAPACPHVRSNAAMNWCALTEQSALAEPDPEPAPLPPIRVGQKWRRFDGKTVYVVSPMDSALGYAFVCRDHVRDVYSNSTYTADGKYINDSLPRGECGRDLAELVEDAPEPAPAEPAPPAPAGGLVEEIKGLLGHYGDSSARAAINVVAEWLEQRSSSPITELDSITYGAHLLRQEATR